MLVSGIRLCNPNSYITGVYDKALTRQMIISHVYMDLFAISQYALTTIHPMSPPVMTQVLPHSAGVSNHFCLAYHVQHTVKPFNNELVFSEILKKHIP